MKCDPHNYPERLRMFRSKIQESPSITPANKALIARFEEHLISNGLSIGRVVRYLYDLRNLAEWLPVDFEAATAEDLRRIVVNLESGQFARRDQSGPYATSTKRDLKITLRTFYRWLRKTHNPPELEWMRIREPPKRIRPPEELLSEDDILRLLQAADHPRSRAFLAVLYESGCRIGELLGLQIKNVTIDQYGAALLVDGKTGFRRVRVVWSVRHLVDWINQHPWRSDPDAPVWTCLERKGIPTYTAAKAILERLRDRAGITKKVNPQNFRHSRATFLANHLTEAQMKEFFGWVQASKMAAVYVHLAGRDIDNAILMTYGLKKQEKTGPQSPLLDRLCEKCGAGNSAGLEYCVACSAPLHGRMKDPRSEKTAGTILETLLADPEIGRLLLGRHARILPSGSIAARIGKSANNVKTSDVSFP